MLRLFVLYTALSLTANAAAAADLGALKTDDMKKLVVYEQPLATPELPFVDETGAEISLADFKGRTVLLNLWATWCAPCRKEIPDLAKLQKEMGGPAFEVVALSLDRKGAEASSAFLKETGADNLALYTDLESKALAAVNALGLPATLLVTPHPAEAARLLGQDVAAVQADRFAAARALARRHAAVVVLKGCGSLVAAPDGRVALCPWGNPGMASGGMGDVLTGVIAALLAQGLNPFVAARAGVYLHGRAGDRAAMAGGERGLLAGDLLNFLRQQVNPD